MEGVSAQIEFAQQWANAFTKCQAPLQDLGSRSARYVSLFGMHGLRTPRVAEFSVQDDVFRDGSSSPATIGNYVKGFKCFLAWCHALQLPITEATDFRVAEFLKDQAPRGKSVPHRVHRALIWAEKAFDVQLYFS